MRRRTLPLLIIIGAGCVVAGVYLRFGAWLALVVGGVAAVVAGLVVDDGVKVD